MTLIASIYGTNFHHVFPPYGWRGGFGGMIGTFIVSAAGLLWWFRYRRWI
jgi:Mg2+ and Co2+ transporter CorA